MADGEGGQVGESHKKAATDRGGVKALVVWRDADEVRVALFLRAQRTSQEKERDHIPPPWWLPEVSPLTHSPRLRDWYTPRCRRMASRICQGRICHHNRANDRVREPTGCERNDRCYPIEEEICRLRVFTLPNGRHARCHRGWRAGVVSQAVRWLA